MPAESPGPRSGPGSQADVPIDPACTPARAAVSTNVPSAGAAVDANERRARRGDTSLDPPEPKGMRIALGDEIPIAQVPDDWLQIRPLVLAYLRAGRVVLETPDTPSDKLDSEDEASLVPLGFRTDGTWIWSQAVPYYLERNGGCIDLRLLEHIRRCGFLPPSVTRAQVDTALTLLGNAGRVIAWIHEPRWRADAMNDADMSLFDTATDEMTSFKS